MSISSNNFKQSFTSHDIDAWLLAAQEQHAKLHLHAAGPCNNDERYEAFAGISELLLEAFEEMRLVSESLREESQAMRGKSAALRANSHQLMERGKTLAAITEQFVAPPPEEIQQAESRMLEIFKHGQERKDADG